MDHHHCLQRFDACQKLNGMTWEPAQLGAVLPIDDPAGMTSSHINDGLPFGIFTVIL